MSANRPRSIKEFFTRKESRQQESCLRENGNPTPSESSENPNNRKLFSEIGRLLRLYLTVPATRATAERTFSVLRRLKSYLRATMTQERLNNVILLNIYQSELDDRDIHGIAEKFATCNESRRAFFGSFE